MVVERDAGSASLASGHRLESMWHPTVQGVGCHTIKTDSRLWTNGGHESMQGSGRNSRLNG